MPVTIELISEDPIILATFTGEMTVEDALSVFQYTVDIEEQYQGKIYRIHDFRESNVTFPTMMNIIKEARKNVQGSVMDQRVQMVFVGGNPITDFARDAINQTAHKVTPVFQTVERAIEAINVGMLGKPQQSKDE